MHAALERLRTIFARTVCGEGPVMTEGCISAALNLLKDNDGVAVGEVHGDYAHARFVKTMIEKAAKQGVKNLYVEMFQQPNQGMIDLWQDGGKPGLLLEHINSKGRAYSANNWQHYWDVLETAKAHGIRVIAIEPQTVPATAYPILGMMVRNFKWQECIEKAQAEFPGKYILYCGSGHLEPRMTGANSTMQQLMNIKGVSLHRGMPSFMPSLRLGHLFHCNVLKAPDQTPINGMQVVPFARVKPSAHVYH